MTFMPENKKLLHDCTDWMDAINGKTVPRDEAELLAKMLVSMAEEMRIRGMGQEPAK